jgi:uncharacterized cupredoxin-like copper-binding protein
MRFAAALIVAASLSAACGGGAATTSANTVITVTQDDKTITLDRASVPSGVVTFKLVNASTIVHSLFLLKTDLPHDKIPADPKDGSKVQLPGLLRESGQVAAGLTKEFSVKLEPGTYVLVCNEPAHYIVGMHVGFTVR